MDLRRPFVEQLYNEDCFRIARYSRKFTGSSLLLLGFGFAALLSHMHGTLGRGAQLLASTESATSLVWQQRQSASAQFGKLVIVQLPRPSSLGSVASSLLPSSFMPPLSIRHRFARESDFRLEASREARSSLSPAPESAQEAIIEGANMMKDGDPMGALEIFQKGFKLWGSGTLRDRKKPRELSEIEKISLHYNMACCFCMLGEEYYDEALKSLTSAMEEGFRDFERLKTSSGLKNLREGDAEGFQRFLEFWEPKKSRGLFDFFR